VTVDDPLSVPPNLLPELRIGLLDDLQLAAEGLQRLVLEGHTDGPGDVEAKHVQLHELTTMIDERSVFQPLVGWPGAPVEELHLEPEHRDLALAVLTTHRERLVETLLSSPLHEDKDSLFARIQALTSFLRRVGVVIQQVSVGG
jgi:hypothetical protein